MKGTTNAQRNAIIDSTSAVDSLTLTKADGTTQKHTVSNIIPKDDAPTSGSSKFVTSGAIYTALDKKVDKVTGKGLSTNDYTTAEKSKVSNLPANANTTFATKTELTDALSSVYKYKGSVNTYGNLPSNATAGDVYNVVASYNGVPAGTNWAWNGSSWDALGGTVTGYVADTTTVNGKPLSSNVTLTAADVSAVPTTRTVNGKALSSDITLAASDVGALASGGTAARATADASGNVITSTYATKSALETGLAGKQNALTFDSAPTSGSSNPVTSGGVYSAINTVNTSISSLQSLVAGKQDKLTFDTTPTSGSSNPITSGGVYTAINNKMDKKTIDTKVTSGSSNLITSGAVYTAINSGGSAPFSTLYTDSLSSILSFNTSNHTYTVSRTFMIQYRIVSRTDIAASNNYYTVFCQNLIIPAGTFPYYRTSDDSYYYSSAPGNTSLTVKTVTSTATTTSVYFFTISAQCEVRYYTTASKSSTVMSQVKDLTATSFIKTGYVLYI